MENATKALLIAAAILIAILVISLGLVAYNMAAQQMQSADMTEAELTQFNGKFQAYEDTNATANDVNAMLNTVLTHNSAEAQSGRGLYVEVTAGNTGAVSLATSATSVANRATTGYYTIQCSLTAGRVSSITVTKN